MVGKRTFGEVSLLPSGRFRARYTGPDGNRHAAPHTFDTKLDADTWLTLRRAEIITDDWKPRANGKGVKFGPYATKWIAERPKLKPRTREHYQNILVAHLATFADVPLRHISPEMVDEWHADLDTGPTMKAHAYSLLRTVMNTALDRGLVAANPCRIRGASATTRVHKIRPASLEELRVAAAAMPERYQLMTLLAAWCGMRYGELAALRRHDIDLTSGVVRIRRGVARVRGQMIEGTPKSDAGVRDVSIPPHLLPLVADHLASHAAPGRTGLLFPSGTGEFLPTVTLYKYWYPARREAGRPDLRWHDLRHTGAVLAAATGATLAELMARLGHSTPGAALRYQHAAADRDKVIAAKLSEMAQS